MSAESIHKVADFLKQIGYPIALENYQSHNIIAAKPNKVEATWSEVIGVVVRDAADSQTVKEALQTAKTMGYSVDYYYIALPIGDECGHGLIKKEGYGLITYSEGPTKVEHPSKVKSRFNAEATALSLPREALLSIYKKYNTNAPAEANQGSLIHGLLNVAGDKLFRFDVRTRLFWSVGEFPKRASVADKPVKNLVQEAVEKMSEKPIAPQVVIAPAQTSTVGLVGVQSMGTASMGLLNDVVEIEDDYEEEVV